MLMCVLVVGLCLALTWRNNRARLANAELLSLFNALEIGMTIQEFDRTYVDGSFRTLKARSVSTNVILIQTPLQWGGANWLMWIGLSDGKIESLRIRLQDSKDSKPSNTPEDKQKDNTHGAAIIINSKLMELPPARSLEAPNRVLV